MTVRISDGDPTPALHLVEPSLVATPRADGMRLMSAMQSRGSIAARSLTELRPPTGDAPVTFFSRMRLGSATPPTSAPEAGGWNVVDWVDVAEPGRVGVHVQRRRAGIGSGHRVPGPVEVLLWTGGVEAVLHRPAEFQRP